MSLEKKLEILHCGTKAECLGEMTWQGHRRTALETIYMIWVLSQVLESNQEALVTECYEQLLF